MIAEIGARAIVTMAASIEPVLKSGGLDPALLETANLWFDRSWWGLMISGGITALAACATVAFLILQFWSSGVKERFSDDRLAANEAETKRAIADSDIAKQGAAVANARAAEAQLALERLKAPRSLSSAQAAQIASLIKPFAGQQYSGMVAGSVPDARGLWVALDKILTAANWIRVPPWGAAAGDPPAGIPIAPNEGVTLFLPTADVNELFPAAKALASALIVSGIAAFIAIDGGPQTRPKITVIEIGTKPQ